jgi:hypothetical protein
VLSIRPSVRRKKCVKRRILVANSKKMPVCTTLLSLNKDIQDAQKRVDRGDVSALGSLNFRKERKASFLSGQFDDKLIAQGCKPLGGVVETEPRPAYAPTSSSNNSDSQQMKVDSVSSTPIQIDASQNKRTTSYASSAPSYEDSTGGGARKLFWFAVIGGGLFLLYKKGKLDGVISKGKELVGKIKKK